MVESYQHFTSLPDSSFAERSISVLIQPGSQYKDMVSKESCIAVQVNRILKSSLEEKDLLTASNQMKYLITECGYASERKSYNDYMRSIFNRKW